MKAPQILAGYAATGASANADAEMRKVLVRGQWIASDLVAGVSAGAEGIFASVDDTLT